MTTHAQHNFETPRRIARFAAFWHDKQVSVAVPLYTGPADIRCHCPKASLASDREHQDARGCYNQDFDGALCAANAYNPG
jgi:hypothetical protein